MYLWNPDNNNKQTTKMKCKRSALEWKREEVRERWDGKHSTQATETARKCREKREREMNEPKKNIIQEDECLKLVNEIAFFCSTHKTATGTRRTNVNGECKPKKEAERRRNHIYERLDMHFVPFAVLRTRVALQSAQEERWREIMQHCSRQQNGVNERTKIERKKKNENGIHEFNDTAQTSETKYKMINCFISYRAMPYLCLAFALPHPTACLEQIHTRVLCS